MLTEFMGSYRIVARIESIDESGYEITDLKVEQILITILET